MKTKLFIIILLVALLIPLVADAGGVPWPGVEVCRKSARVYKVRITNVGTVAGHIGYTPSWQEPEVIINNSTPSLTPKDIEDNTMSIGVDLGVIQVGQKVTQRVVLPKGQNAATLWVKTGFDSIYGVRWTFRMMVILNAAVVPACPTWGRQ